MRDYKVFRAESKNSSIVWVAVFKSLSSRPRRCDRGVKREGE
jgi:hypothetical protein